MFSLSHPEDGTFRLDIHAPPSDIDEAEARRLRAVLLGLARELGAEADESEADESPDERSISRTVRPLRPHGRLERESAR